MLFLLALLLAQFPLFATVSFSWDPNPEPDVIGYRLHYGNSSGTYTSVIDVGNSTNATVSNFPTHTTYFLAVTAYNAAGFESLPSNEVSVDVPNQPPAVSITSPGAGTDLNGPGSLSLTVSASDQDGTVAKVEFYEGTTRLGQTSTAPFSFIWAAAPVGSHTISAVAFDNDGTSTQSAPIFFTVVRLATNTVRRLTGGAIEINGECAIGSTIYVYASSDLVHWTLLAPVTNTRGSFVITDSDAGNYDKRFYRVQGD